ncbi:MAG: MetS family NSS transporter small subunit [Gemmatimonadaceae bacterium]|nr:MetS family NSS transporter small subunit [Gemmatimonadaceae bacterium]
MTTLGWIFMALSLTMVWGGAFWCYRQVLKTPAEEKVPVGFGP